MQSLSLHTRLFGKQIVFEQSIPSTNKRLIDLLAEDMSKISEGTVLVTPKQTHGKGQLDRKWTSDPGMNLTFSLALFPKNMQADKLFVLNQIFSLGVLHALINLGLNPELLKIKWPNDVLYAKRKISGILIENLWNGPNLKYSVIGIGININQQKFIYLEKDAVSVASVIGTKIDLEKALYEVLTQCEQVYDLFLKGDMGKITRDYYNNCLYFEEKRDYLVDGKVVSGRFVGVDPSGRFILQTTKGETTYRHGEIDFIF